MSTLTQTEQIYQATWYVQHSGNDISWRCEMPASVIGGRVAKIKENVLNRAVSCPNTDTGFPWHLVFETPEGPVTARTKTEYRRLARRSAHTTYSSVRAVFPEHQGVSVWTRPCGHRAMLAASMREQGILTVAETDDNYFADKKFNLHQRQVEWDEAEKEVVCRAMASMDRNVYSTEWLRDRYWKEMKKRLGRQHLPEMFVCRNSIPVADWPERDEGEGRIRVGFMGSGSHVWDINHAYSAFHAAKTYADTETIMIGYNPAEPDQEPDEFIVDGEVVWKRSDKSIEYRDKWRQVVDRHIPWIDPGDYRRAALPLDIGVAPIARADDFTMGKSDAKMLEYTISGAAGVCWNIPIYNTAGWVHEQNCLMANTAEDMAIQVLRLVKDPKLRFELVTAAQEMVASERNEHVLANEWKDALDL